MAKPQVDTRQFSVDPSMIFSLITAQAGTLAKAVLECVMNSVDANATKVDIQLTPTKLTVVDNGKGFATKDEILSCFEVFGFKHTEGERKYGQFGIGRAQLWAFCKTLWRTNAFSMDVDIKNKGLDYDLRAGLVNKPGLTIQGTFYARQTTKDILDFERELTELARYAQCELTVNGKRIDHNPAEEKWTHETPEAWIRLKETGVLTVYNLGVKVRDYAGHVVGAGGVVVTKPNVRLSLNMARNDILISQCGVWKRIKPFLQQQADKSTKKTSSRMNDDQIQNLIERVRAGDVPYEEIESRKLIMDVQGKQHSIESFGQKISKLGTLVAVSERGNTAAERAHRLNYGFVLAPITLTRFGVESAPAFQHLLLEILKQASTDHRYARHPSSFIERAIFDRDCSEITANINNRYDEIAEKDLTAHEKAVLKALDLAQNKLLKAMRLAGVIENDEQLKNRSLHAGESEVAQAWTYPSLTSAGRGRIVFRRGELDNAKGGLSGILALAHLMVHEYLHEGSDTQTHQHDLEFYERYHNVMSTTAPAVAFGDFVTTAYRLYLRELQNRGLRVLAPQVRDIDTMDEAFDLADPVNDADDGQQAA